MHPAVIRVMARLTDVGAPWPIGAWVYVESWTGRKPSKQWFQVKPDAWGNSEYRRESDELSELEANARGIYRTETKE